MDETVNTVTSVLWVPTKALATTKFAGHRPMAVHASADAASDEEADHGTSVHTPDANRQRDKAAETDELGPEFNMDNYDDEDETDQTHLFSVVDADMRLAQDRDDYMNDEVSDSEDEDYYDIKENDVLFVAANVEEDACTVEVYLHDTFDGGMYVHHDFLISSYPLALEYIPSMALGQSFLAIGAMDPSIDIWDLKVHDPVEPVMQLGKKRGHTKAVIALHLCPQNPSVLASGSADTTVRLWDLERATAVSTLTHHKADVQCVKWHPLEAGILMTAGYDKKLVITDQRAGANTSAVVTLGSDPECTIWSRHSPTMVLVSDEDGHISAHDMRKVGEPLWRIKAHQKGACTSFTDVVGHSDLLISAGIDGVANIWKSSKCAEAPQLVLSRDLKAGPLFSVSSHNDEPALTVFGASCPVLWNITDSDVVCKVFPTLPGADQPNLPEMEQEEEDEDLDD